MSERTTTEIVDNLRMHATRSTIPTHAEMREAADRLERLEDDLAHETGANAWLRDQEAAP